MKNRGKKGVNLVFLMVVLFGLSSCDENNNLVLFSIEDDKALGLQVSNEIANDPSTYPVLSRAENPEAYAYLDAMTSSILNSGAVAYKSEFVWKVHIIDDPNTLNAFATPGGYIYVYTGLINYLEKADHLAGVLGHEIAHADLRHTSRNIQKEYGIGFLLSLFLGDETGQFAQIASELATGALYLKFSRSFEQESDEKSVQYLGQTDYACNGAAGFFQKLLDSGQTGGTPQFLSTHPAEDSRVTDINAKATEVGCDITEIAESGMDYPAFKALFN